MVNHSYSIWGCYGWPTLQERGTDKCGTDTCGTNEQWDATLVDLLTGVRQKSELNFAHLYNTTEYYDSHPEWSKTKREDRGLESNSEKPGATKCRTINVDGIRAWAVITEAVRNNNSLHPFDTIEEQ